MIGLSLLILFFLYYKLVKIVIGHLVKFPKTDKGKTFVRCALILVGVFLPFWDVPIINYEFNRLCKNESGIHVYEEVALEPKYWRKNGTLIFLPTKEFLKNVIPEGFEVIEKREPYYSSISRVKKYQFQIKRKQDQKIIGEIIRYIGGKNWISRSVFPEGGTFCPSFDELSENSIAKAVFKQKSEN